MSTRIINLHALRRHAHKIAAGTACFCLFMALFLLPSKHLTAAKAETFVVKQHTRVETQQFKGRLFPRESRTLSSPGDALLETLIVKEGERVQKGQILATLKSARLENELLEAKQAWIDTKQKYHTYEIWNDTRDIQAVKNQRLRAERELKRAKESYLSAARLYDLGIVSHNEVADLKTAMDDRALELETAKKDFQLAQEKGVGPEKQMAEIALNVAEKKLKALEEKKAALVLQAPFDGWVLWPEQKQDKDQKHSAKLFPQIGNVYKEDEAVLAVCDASGFNVSFSVDEYQINKIKPGMPVEITVSQLQDTPFHGTLSELSAKGEFDTGATAAQFKTVASVDKISLKDFVFRTGLSASVVLQDKNEALTIPISAVYEKDEKPYVKIKTPAGITEHAITLKETTPTEAVVLSGIKEGDEIVISHQAQSHQ